LTIDNLQIRKNWIGPIHRACADKDGNFAKISAQPEMRRTEENSVAHQAGCGSFAQVDQRNLPDKLAAPRRLGMASQWLILIITGAYGVNVTPIMR
jgi:hypothetical protein